MQFLKYVSILFKYEAVIISVSKSIDKVIDLDYKSENTHLLRGYINASVIRS